MPVPLCADCKHIRDMDDVGDPVDPPTCRRYMDPPRTYPIIAATLREDGDLCGVDAAGFEAKVAST